MTRKLFGPLLGVGVFLVAAPSQAYMAGPLAAREEQPSIEAPSSDQKMPPSPEARAADKASLPEARRIIAEAQKIIEPRGIQELKSVRIGGIDQWISVRGRDRRNPILLFIHGGPGRSEMPASWTYESPWEDFFTVVQWDQRGGGITGAKNDIAVVGPTITAERIVNDGEELVAYLRQHYGKQKIFVLGHSWGSVVGLRIAQRHPDWLHAYIGVGQSMYKTAGERAGYEWALSRARELNDQAGIAALTALAPYPELDGTVSTAKVREQRKWVDKYGGLTWGRPDYKYDDDIRRLSPEYDEQDLSFRGGNVTDRLRPDMNKIDFRGLKHLDCPVFIFAGRHDYQTPSQVSADWFSKLDAPEKHYFWFENSAHVTFMEEPGKFLMHLVNDVRPIAVRAGDAPPDDN